ncbi:MAG: hypothetical protein HYR55_05375 [Acidobacteria bacterium]|nr:hypothetical protein [Acidobacteriota bacterium]MBI3657825.1 hypothetical protein [Acidobacteriota bacterium]
MRESNSEKKNGRPSNDLPRPWVMMGVLVFALTILSLGIYFKRASTHGFNPLATLPLVAPPDWPNELKMSSDDSRQGIIVRSFDLNQDGTVEYFVLRFTDPRSLPNVTVFSGRGRAWSAIAQGQILGVLQSRTHGYYDLLMRVPNDPSRGRFQAGHVRLSWSGHSYTE